MRKTGFSQYLRNYDFRTYMGMLAGFWFSYGMLFPVFTLYLMTECSFSMIEVGKLTSYFWTVMVILQLPTGVIADRFGRKRAFLCSTLCSSAAMGALLCAKTFWMFILSQTLFALGRAFFDGAMLAWIVDRLNLNGRKHLTWIVSIEQGLFGFGMITGGFASDIAAQRYGTYRAPLFAMLIAMTLMTAFGWKFIRESRRTPTNLRRRGMRSAALHLDPDMSLPKRMIVYALPLIAPVYAVLGALLRKRMLRVVMVIGFMHTLTFSAIATYWPICMAMMVHGKGFAGKFNGLFTLAWFIGGMVTFWLVTQKKSEVKLFASGAVACACGHAALWFGIASLSIIWVSAGLCCFYYGYGSFNPIMKRYLNAYATPSMRATLISCYGIMCAAGTAIGQWRGSVMIFNGATIRDGFLETWVIVSAIFCLWASWFAFKLRGNRPILPKV